MRIACLVLLIVLAGCGTEAVPVADDGERGVREAAARYAEAVRFGDARALCSQQVAKELRDRLAAMGADCARDFFASAVKDGGPKYTLTVRSIRIDGDRALAQVTEVGRRGRHDDEFPFVRESDGRWRTTLTPPEASAQGPDQRAVKRTAERYAALIRAGDAEQICAQLVSAEFKRFMAAHQNDCVRDFYAADVQRGGPKYSLRVSEVRVDGDHADALGEAEGIHGPYGATLSFARDPDGSWGLAL